MRGLVCPSSSNEAPRYPIWNSTISRRSKPPINHFLFYTALIAAYYIHNAAIHCSCCSILQSQYCYIVWVCCIYCCILQSQCSFTLQLLLHTIVTMLLYSTLQLLLHTTATIQLCSALQLLLHATATATHCSNNADIHFCCCYNCSCCHNAVTHFSYFSLSLSKHTKCFLEDRCSD